MDQIKSTDGRRHSFFIIDNEILDNFELSPLDLAIYCHLVRYAGNTREAYLSNSKLAKSYKKGRNTIIKSIKSLQEKGLIFKKVQSNGKGLNEYIILDVPKREIKKKKKDPVLSQNREQMSSVPPENSPVSSQNTPCSVGEHPLFPDRTQRIHINNTNTKKEDRKEIDVSLSLKKQDLFSEISTFWESKTSVKLRQTKNFIQKWNSVIAEVPELTVKRAVERFLSDTWRMDKPKARTASVLFKSVENIEVWGAKKTDSFKPNTRQAKTKDLEINTNTANSLITYENIIKNSSLSKEEISIWEKVKEHLRKNIKPVFFTKFIGDLMPVVFDGDRITAITRSVQIARHVNARYKNELQEAFFKQMGKKIRMNVLSAEDF